MTDFFTVLEEIEIGLALNYYSAKKEDGVWLEGLVSIQFLNDNFGSFDNATDMKNATESEGLHLFFDDLVSQGKLPE